MIFGREINVNELPDYEGTVVPAGWYTATIVKAEVRQTKRGDGQYLAVQYTIVGPTHQGRTVWGNITVVNPNESAVRIGLSQLKELLLAAGVAKIADAAELSGRTLQIKVAIRKDDQYGESNDVRGWRAAAAPPPPTFPKTNNFPPHQPQQPVPPLSLASQTASDGRPSLPKQTTPPSPPWAAFRSE